MRYPVLPPKNDARSLPFLIDLRTVSSLCRRTWATSRTVNQEDLVGLRFVN